MPDFDFSDIPSSTEVAPANKNSLVSKVKKINFKLIGIIIFIGIILGTIWMIFYLKNRNRADFLTIGMIKSDSSALIILADENEFFEEAGLKIDIKEYAREDEVLDALNEGLIDIASVFPFYLSSATHYNESNKIFAATGSFDNNMVIADLVKGIYRVEDLRDKKLALTPDTEIEFWLEQGLKEEGVNAKQLNIVEMNPDELAKELANARVDAVAAWQPYAYEILTFVNTEYSALAWSLQGDILNHNVLVADKEYLLNNNEKLQEFLKVLVKSESYLKQNPVESSQIVATKIGVEQTYTEKVWPSYNYELYLNNKILDLIEEQQNWRVENKQYEEDNIPEMQSIVFTGILKQVKPKSITFSE